MKVWFYNYTIGVYAGRVERLMFGPFESFDAALTHFNCECPNFNVTSSDTYGDSVLALRSFRFPRSEHVIFGGHDTSKPLLLSYDSRPSDED